MTALFVPLTHPNTTLLLVLVFAKLKIVILMLIPSSRIKGFCSSSELGGGVFKMKIALNSLNPKLGSKWSKTYFKVKKPLPLPSPPTTAPCPLKRGKPHKQTTPNKINKQTNPEGMSVHSQLIVTETCKVIRIIFHFPKAKDFTSRINQ